MDEASDLVWLYLFLLDWGVFVVWVMRSDQLQAHVDVVLLLLVLKQSVSCLWVSFQRSVGDAMWLICGQKLQTQMMFLAQGLNQKKG